MIVYVKKWQYLPLGQMLRSIPVTYVYMVLPEILSQPNNNHDPNNKTTITIVGLRQSNHREHHHHHHPPTTTNSKLHDRAEIEQNSENKSYQSIWGDTKTVFKSYPNPKIAHWGPKKPKMTPKLSQNQKSELKETKQIKVV